MEAIREGLNRWDACPICDSYEFSDFVGFSELAFVRCRCGAVFKSFERVGLRPEGFYERAYFHGRKSGRDLRFEHRVRKAQRWLRNVLELVPAKSVLDVGCSLGYVVKAGETLGLRAAGSDVSFYAVEVCRTRGLRAEVGELDAQPFRDGEFDLVVMKHVLEHTPSPRDALREVRRLLTPGGGVLIAVPQLSYWKGLLLRRSYRYFRPDDLGQQHYVYYTEETLSRLLESCGFRVLTTSKAFFRSSMAARSTRDRIKEHLRYAGLRIGLGLLRWLHLQREVFVVAQVVAEE